MTRGYVAAVCNVRGSGDSPGYLDPFSAQEQHDNYDLIEWLARQRWATGRVGQMGVSYGGHSSLLVAVNKPPHLAAIIPVDGISDWYENTIYRGGMVENFQACKENVWLVAGPWQHGMPAGQYADIGTGAFLAWWDHWLARRPAPLPAKEVTTFETPTGGWAQYDDWPPLAARTRKLALSGDGGLAPGQARPFRAAYTVNTEPAPGTPEERLVFRTDPLGTDLVLAGVITATVRTTFSAADGNLAVVVSDVAPAGTATRITQGWLKASHRAGHERPAQVRPGVAYDLRVQAWPAHYRIAAGHRLEVTVASDDYPEIDSDAPAGKVILTRGAVTLTVLS